MTDVLAADTAMGAVTLNVADLDAMTSYYRDAVGLDLLSQEGPRTTLGRAARRHRRAIVILEHTPALKHAAPHEAGLFHTAILFDTAGGARRSRLLGGAEASRPVHRIERPSGEQGVLLRRPGGQRRRALLGPGPQRVVVGARHDRDGHDLPRPEPVPAAST